MMEVVLEIQTKFLKLSKIITIAMVKTTGQSNHWLRSYGPKTAILEPFGVTQKW